MKRLLGIVGSMLITLIILVPVAFAADELPQTGRVLIAVGGDMTVPAGEHVDAVLVIGGTATILGEVNTVISVDGAADLRGATVETVVAVGSSVSVGDGTTVFGDVFGLDATVTTATGATLGGEVRDLALQMVGVGAVLGPALLLLFLGIALVTIVAGLFLAGIAARQVREAGLLISREPGPVLVVGLAGLFAPLLLVLGLFVTVVGAPLGVAILVFVWPFTAYLGYLVAGIWIGDWILHRLQPDVVRERPYLASVIGLAVLQVGAVLPPISAVASLFGYGAVILLAWRVFRSGQAGASTIHAATPAPMPS